MFIDLSFWFACVLSSFLNFIIPLSLQLTPKTYYCEQEKIKLITDKSYDFVE